MYVKSVMVVCCSSTGSALIWSLHSDLYTLLSSGCHQGCNQSTSTVCCMWERCCHWHCWQTESHSTVIS